MNILLPKATAIWMIDNTSLTFEQISDVTDLGLLEIQAIADGDIDQNIHSSDPVLLKQISKEEILKGEEDKNYKLTLLSRDNKYKVKGHKYVPISQRMNKPNAILFLVKNHQNLSNTQIIKLIGTTKNTIDAIRNKTYWNIAKLRPIDPVALDICKQKNVDEQVAIAQLREERQKLNEKKNLRKRTKKTKVVKT